MKTNLTFADISFLNSMEKNRTIKRMEYFNATVDWSKIESLLMRNYPVGKSFEGNDAYPPLHFGLKEHASVDTRYGFVLATEMTPASHHDRPYCQLPP